MIEWTGNSVRGMDEHAIDLGPSVPDETGKGKSRRDLDAVLAKADLSI
jgi:hypothetical protein